MLGCVSDEIFLGTRSTHIIHVLSPLGFATFVQLSSSSVHILSIPLLRSRIFSYGRKNRNI